MASTNSISSMLYTNRLTGINYRDWLRNLKIVLKYEKIAYVLDDPIPPIPEDGSPEEVISAYIKWVDDDEKARCIILASMNNELQKQHEEMQPSKTILLHLQELYGEQSRVERFNIVKELFRTRMPEGSSVHEHGLKMINYIEQLQRLDVGMDADLTIDIVLQSLPHSFSQFVMNYYMNKMGVTLPELLNMLVTAEGAMIRTKGSALIVDVGKASSSRTGYKPKSKPKQKGNKWKKGKQANLKPKAGIKKNGNNKNDKGRCFECGELGHWKRNCKIYLASIKDNTSGMSNMLFIETELSVSSTSDWVLDTGASSHICNSMQDLKESRRLSRGQESLRVGNGARVAALAVGTCYLTLSSGYVLSLQDCLFVPNIVRNIISISALCNNGYYLVFEKNQCSLKLNDDLIGTGIMMNGLYYLNTNGSINSIEHTKNARNPKRLRDEGNPTYMWHLRLGHISEKRIHSLVKDGHFGSLAIEPLPTCESCLMGKMTKSPFVGHGERAADILGLIHSDVCGPFKSIARGGYSYFITFTDDHSRLGYVYLMRYKSESFEKFKEFRNEVEKQTSKHIKVLRSDRGGEYLSTDFLDHLKDNGILSQWTPPGTPQLNGVSERRNRTLLDMVRSMMSYTDLPISFWGYALETATYILNRVPSKSVPQTPYEIWNGKKPSLNHVKIWGCPAYVKKHDVDKLEARSDKCRFVGYPKESLGYYFYHPTEQKVFVSKFAIFLEKEFLQEGSKGNKVELEEEFNEPQNQPMIPFEVGPSNTQPLRKSIRVSAPPERYGYLLQGDEIFHLGNIDYPNDPNTYKEAMSDIDSRKWQEAMKSEMDSMYTNQVWTLVDPPEGIVPIGCKWIYKRKIGSDGKIETYKARLVAKGYKQRQGVDYEETFSPVAMLKSIRILLAIAAHYDYEIWQMDVKTAFLNGNIVEDLYMEQPEGFISSGEDHKVCKLKRSIYGLKQASRNWNIRFDEAIKSFGFLQNMDEPCVYKKISGKAISFLILYVDDILLIGNDVGVLSSVKLWLSQNFSMKDLGIASYILGIKVYRDRSKRLLGLSQSMYIDKVLKRFNMQDSKRGLLPFRHGIHLSKDMSPKTPDERENMSKIPYASAIGSIMYSMLCTRPDISHAVSVTSRYQSNPGSEHWMAVKNILKYLRRTKDIFLVYGGGELRVDGYTDSDFQSDVDDRKSTSGYVFTLNGGAISWKSCKQDTTADSTTEAEYIAASEASKEAVWIKKFVTELGVVPIIESPIPLYCDNNGAIAQAKEPRSHQKSKHIERRFHMIREIIGRGDVSIQRVASIDNVADPLTKALTQQQLDHHLEKMGMRYVVNWL